MWTSSTILRLPSYQYNHNGCHNPYNCTSQGRHLLIDIWKFDLGIITKKSRMKSFVWATFFFKSLLINKSESTKKYGNEMNQKSVTHKFVGNQFHSNSSHFFVLSCKFEVRYFYRVALSSRFAVWSSVLPSSELLGLTQHYLPVANLIQTKSSKCLFKFEH